MHDQSTFLPILLSSYHAPSFYPATANKNLLTTQMVGKYYKSLTIWASSFALAMHSNHLTHESHHSLEALCVYLLSSYLILLISLQVMRFPRPSPSVFACITKYWRWLRLRDKGYRFCTLCVDYAQKYLLNAYHLHLYVYWLLMCLLDSAAVSNHLQHNLFLCAVLHNQQLHEI